VYVAHDAWPHPGDYWRQWQIGSQQRLIAAVDDVVALSASVADELRRRFPLLQHRGRPRLHLIPLGSVFGPASPAAQYTGGPVRFLFLGRLLAYKGLALLFEAVQQLEPRLDWQLTIAGEGPLEGFVAETFGKHPRCNVETGWLSRSRIEALLRNHDVLVCPYLEGSQSGVIPESLALGMPVIATPVGALPGQIGFGRYGWLAEAVTAEALAAQMKGVTEHPEKLEAVSSAILDHSSDDIGVQRWLDLLSGAKEDKTSVCEAT
jgi:glycosyltransferase involved in cell wall biosynthesis